jgi:GWxTD domain-containing protein
MIGFRIFLLYLGLSMIIPLTSLTQQRPMALDVDLARFRGDDSSLYIEIYYSFNERSLTYTEEGENYKGALDLSIRVRDKAAATLVKENSYLVNHELPDTAGVVGQTLVGVAGLFVEPGDYLFEVIGTDASNAERFDSVVYNLNLSDIPEDHIAVSDIQFANSIQQIEDPGENIFYKNTLEVIPNPSRIFGIGHPILFFYVEVYNLLSHIPDGNYDVKTVVYDAVGTQFFERNRTKQKIHDSSVEVGTINTSQYKSGSYTLTVSIIDSTANIMANSSRRFFIYNPQHDEAVTARGVGPSGVIASVFSLMTEEEIDKEFEQMRYITSGQDRQFYGQLSELSQKRQFLYEYWNARNPDPTATVNRVREEYLSRVSHANQQFGFGFREGWRSDRGRVYIIYGPPDEYERYPSRSESKPYEIWHYHQIQGGVIFIFIDRTGFQDYQLVHSTHRNELRDDNWREYVRTQ